MNPEQAAIRNLDRRKRTDDIQEAADKLLRNSEHVHQILNELAFQPEDFSNLYGADSIKDDLRYVRNRHEDFRDSDRVAVTEDLTRGDIRKLAERVEYEVIRGINAGHWFEGMGAHKTSEYDDIKNGVDIVLETLEGNSYGHLGLGVDVTFSKDVLAKFRRIKDEIDAYDGKDNRLAVVKYFSSENTGVRGELHSMARAVVAVDLPMLRDMTRLKDADALHDHISKHVTILEIVEQLTTFIEYANEKNPAAAKHLQRSLDFVRSIADKLDSERKVEQSEYLKNRRADEAIEEGLALFR